MRMVIRQSKWLASAGSDGVPDHSRGAGCCRQSRLSQKSPVSYFNDEDMRLLKETVAQVLDDKDAYAKKSWSNPATGNSGEVEARGAFKTAAGVTCKRVRVTNHAKAVDGQAPIPFARMQGDERLGPCAFRPARRPG